MKLGSFAEVHLHPWLSLVREYRRGLDHRRLALMISSLTCHVWLILCEDLALNSLKQGCECTFSLCCGPLMRRWWHGPCIRSTSWKHQICTNWKLLFISGAQGFRWSRNNIWLILCMELMMNKKDLVAEYRSGRWSWTAGLQEPKYLSISFRIDWFRQSKDGWILVAWWILISAWLEGWADDRNALFISFFFFPTEYFCQRSIWLGLLDFKTNLSWNSSY